MPNVTEFTQGAYERLTEETPYAFGSASALIAPAGLEAGCRPNCGPARAPLPRQPLGHHRADPAPERAARVDAYAPLLRRAQSCRQVLRTVRS